MLGHLLLQIVGTTSRLSRDMLGVIGQPLVHVRLLLDSATTGQRTRSLRGYIASRARGASSCAVSERMFSTKEQENKYIN